MNILVVIGAGASFDSWHREISPSEVRHDRLPLANDLYSAFPTQNKSLVHYNLVGFAGIIRQAELDTRNRKEVFNLEEELNKIFTLANTQNDENRKKDLFTSRFYIQDVIHKLTGKTLQETSQHTVYIDMLNQMKDWVYSNRENRHIDIVTFNYDTLLESAMSTVFSHDWINKGSSPLNVYYSGQSFKVFKPHGSINWGREIIDQYDHPYEYIEEHKLINDFQKVKLTSGFKFINPITFQHTGAKNFIPAIAMPFANKEHFEECPQEMQMEMINSINHSDVMITLGWKGGDQNFTSLIKHNGSKIKICYVVSPDGNTQLTSTLDSSKISLIRQTFSRYVSHSNSLRDTLKEIELTIS